MKEVILRIPDKSLQIAEKNAKELGYDNVIDYVTVCAFFTFEEFSKDRMDEHRTDNKEMEQFFEELKSRIHLPDDDRKQQKVKSV